MKSTLRHRNCIIIKGNDRFSFLQGLITNDIKILEEQTAMYACILTPQGKYLADLFIINLEDYLLIDIPANSAEELLLKLNMYKLRSDVNIMLVPHIKVIATDIILNDFDKEIVSFSDPRNKDLGFRYYMNDEELASINNLEESEVAYDLKRIHLYIPEGEKDLIRNKSFPLEYGLDKLNAFSFTKGCYVGQEVVSRTKYTGVIRKKIYKIKADISLEAGVDILVNDRKIGTICSVVDNIGLALLYKESYSEIKDGKVSTDSGHNLSIS